MTTLYLDSETFSAVPITHGTDRYSDDAEVMLVTYAWDDCPPEAIENPARGDVEDMVAFADVVVIHNSFFDRTVFRKALGVEIPTSKIFDTMAGALSHSLPGALGLLGSILGVPVEEAKDKAGKQLIQLFCKPRPATQRLRRATKATHPEEWRRFVEYAKSDITAMRQVYKRLPKWNYDLGKPEHALWMLDQQINDRGIAVDVDLARAVIPAVKARKDQLAAQTDAMTGSMVASTTQRDALLAHLLEWYGITLPDLQKGTLERRIEDESLPDDVRELLRIRLSASSASTAKYGKLLDVVSADGRLRGALQFCGAARTGRWSGRLFQPQNLPRPTLEQEEIDAAIEAFKLGCADMVLPDVIEAAQSALRGLLVASPGKKLVAADLSNIEGRVLAWLACEEWKLEAFRAFDRGEGPDLYKVTAARILGKTPDEVTKDERQSSGKVPELACGYQGAAGAFESMAQLYGLELDKDEVVRIVKQWRKANAAIVKFWYAMEDAAREAVNNPGVACYVGRLAFKRDDAWLKLRLPGGRLLCYPSPRIEDVKSPCPKCDGDGKVLVELDVAGGAEPEYLKCPRCKGAGHLWRSQITYMGINQYTRRWERIKTYGGKLVENAVQATAREVIAGGMLAATEQGFDLLLTVHDEIITEREVSRPDAVELLEGCLSGKHGHLRWTEGLPLAAAGFEAERYRK